MEQAIEISDTVLLGWIGRFGDGVAGRRLAKRVLTTHLEAVAMRLESEVARRAESTVPVPSDAPVDDGVGPDNFVG